MELDLSEEDLGNLRYLALHQIPELLERLLKNLLGTKPVEPLRFLANELKEIRVSSKTKSIEDYININANEISPKTVAVNHNFPKPSAQFSYPEREDSIQSETSTFSVTSVDMADFLMEFRQAYSQITQSKRSNGRLTKAELGDIIDFVAFPTPDRMLTDMFNEIDVEHEGSIDLEIFLARMNFKIQGRFTSEVLKTAFRAVTQDNNVLEKGDLPAAFRQLGFQLTTSELSGLIERSKMATITFEEFQCLVSVYCSTLPPAAITGLPRSSDE
eukprot:NODE_2714_length_1136_cov_25.558418_g2492_i0.p1 GENE.NODE_2714_length_1136_cov_25.558418_g2492_i0~~NODE_2714_length_1136_cov_25.558418_g2492_i0.p1  ORF type:complete len:272 (+),score=35.40 NODE_2714_length_1136_cov_25.558418_g2492_i0:58-873(+)